MASLGKSNLQVPCFVGGTQQSLAGVQGRGLESKLCEPDGLSSDPHTVAQGSVVPASPLGEVGGRGRGVSGNLRGSQRDIYGKGRSCLKQMQREKS